MTKWRVGVGVGVGVALIVVAGGWVASLWGLRTPQHLLVDWVWGGLVVGAVLLVGGARAAGAALVGSSVLSFLAYLLRGYYGGDHLETLVHGAVILGSVGLIGFGLVGVASGGHTPLGRFPEALVLAVGTAIVGTLLILRIRWEVETGSIDPLDTCSHPRGLGDTYSRFALSCFRGFEEPWVQTLLAFNVAFLAALFLVQAWRASRSSGEHEEDDPLVDWLIGRSGGGGPPFLPSR
jgi:hypothetical protein